MNRKVMFLFVATGLAFIQERMDLLDNYANDINVFINLLLIYLLSIPLFVISFFFFFYLLEKKKL